jgi:tetratricopeptide (TPR) repeat protein
MLAILLAVMTSAQCQKTADDWYNTGVDLYGQGKYYEAIEAYDDHQDPNFAVAWYNKGIALKTLGRTTEADAAFAKAEELGYTG